MKENHWIDILVFCSSYNIPFSNCSLLRAMRSFQVAQSYQEIQGEL